MTTAHDRNDYYRDLDALTAAIRAHQPAEAAERAIRARERITIRWLREKPWLAGRGLAATVSAARRTHTASIARSRAAGDTP